MAVRVVQLGTPRRNGEGLRIGTVRRPPRGVPKDQYAARDWFDVWLPNLAPSSALIKSVRAVPADEDGTRAWRTFERRYRAEMTSAPNARLLDLLAALSQSASFSVGCYCQAENRCHRSILRTLLEERGATMVADRG